MDNERFKELINRDEIHRMKKAFKEGDDKKIYEWILQFADQLDYKAYTEYRRRYENDLSESISWYSIAMAYTLWFSEQTTLFTRRESKAKKKERFNNFMKDMNATIELFSTKEMSPMDYAEQLSDEGIDMFDEWIKEQKKGK